MDNSRSIIAAGWFHNVVRTLLSEIASPWRNQIRENDCCKLDGAERQRDNLEQCPDSPKGNDKPAPPTGKEYRKKYEELPD